MAVIMCVCVCTQLCEHACAPMHIRLQGAEEREGRKREPGREEGMRNKEVREKHKPGENWWRRGHRSREGGEAGLGTFSRISSARWHSGSASLYLPLLP